MPGRERSGRSRRLALAGTLAAVLAAGALAVGAAIRSPRRRRCAGCGIHDPERIGPDAVGGVRRDGRAAGVAVSPDAVWIANGTDGVLVRVDRREARVIDTVPIGGDLNALAAGAGAVWAVAADARALVQVNPEVNDVVRRIRVGNGARAVAVGAGGVWVASGLDGTVTRIDPRTGRVVYTMPVGSGPAAVSVGAGGVWVADETDGTVTRLDPRLGRPVATVRVGTGSRRPDRAPRCRLGGQLGGRHGLAHRPGARRRGRDDPRRRRAALDRRGRGSVWVGSGATTTLGHLRPDGAQERLEVGASPAHVALDGDRVFLVLNTRRRPFSDARARRAVALAVDRAHTGLSVGGATWRPTCQLLTPNMPGYAP